MTVIVDSPVRRDLGMAVQVAAASGSRDPEALRRQLYAGWFLAVAEEAPAAGVPAPVDLDPVSALRAAHHDSVSWSGGWRVVRISSRGRVLACRGDELRVVGRNEYLPENRPCLPPRPADAIRITCRRDVVDEDGSFWFSAAGDWEDDQASRGLVRLYWNAPLRCAPDLVRELTTGLHGVLDGYALKVWLTGPGRADGVVVYLKPGDADRAGETIRGVHGTVGDRLRSATPPLTLELAAGLALAEDPGGDESFGESRCRMVAEGIAGAWESGVSEEGEVVAKVIAHLESRGLDPARPHLSAGSKREYRWE